MNKILLITMLLALSASISGQEPARQVDSCFDKAASQTELNACAAEGFNKADAELNRVYKQLLIKRAAQASFIKKLKLAQEAWVKFRDAHMESLYSASEEDRLRAEGSVYPMCKAMEIARLTVERTEALKRMLNPNEGDVCGF